MESKENMILDSFFAETTKKDELLQLLPTFLYPNN